MKFITTKGAPDIPLEILEAQENQELVFFCGAGISYPAGLPLFGKLVDDVYVALAERPDEYFFHRSSCYKPINRILYRYPFYNK